MKQTSVSLVAIMTLLLMAACAGTNIPESPAPQGGEQVFVGLASFYGNEFAGRTTASGEKYDPTKYTAAHRTLPFGTKALVTNLENNMSVLVTITDRGPQRPDRIIDLSFAAAQDLNMITAGIVKVRVEVIFE